MFSKTNFMCRNTGFCFVHPKLLHKYLYLRSFSQKETSMPNMDSYKVFAPTRNFLFIFLTITDF